MQPLSRKLLGGLVALLFVVFTVQSQAIVTIAKKVSGEDQTAQITGATSPLNMRPINRTYGVADNSIGQTGIYFPVKKIIAVSACGGGGGGGGGAPGYEDGSNAEGAGGGAGGGGGKGNCITQTLKIKPGDTLRWLVGTGGYGGRPGMVGSGACPTPSGVIPFPGDATDGHNGNTTYVSVNGINVIQAYGGWGGRKGYAPLSNPWNEEGADAVVGQGGLGGSTDPNLWSAWGHAGEDGQLPFFQDNNMGSGGYGGNGEGQTGLLTNRGIGGSSWGSNFYGGHGGAGSVASGGGGGGGGGGRWSDTSSVLSCGGYGGNGGDGSITISG